MLGNMQRCSDEKYCKSKVADRQTRTVELGSRVNVGISAHVRAEIRNGLAKLKNMTDEN